MKTFVAFLMSIALVSSALAQTKPRVVEDARDPASTRQQSNFGG